MKICMIGTGYVGLVTAVIIANNGHKVICIDSDENKINKLKQNILPFYESGLKELIEKNKRNLTFTTDIDYAIKNSEVIFVAVGTPQNKDGSANLDDVIGVAKQISMSMNENKYIVIKSTVPVGTCNQISTEIDNIAKQGQRVSDEMQTVSAATQEQSASSSEIARASDSLSHLADELQTSLKRFKY